MTPYMCMVRKHDVRSFCIMQILGILNLFKSY